MGDAEEPAHEICPRYPGDAGGVRGHLSEFFWNTQARGDKFNFAFVAAGLRIPKELGQGPPNSASISGVTWTDFMGRFFCVSDDRLGRFSICARVRAPSTMRLSCM